MNSQLKTPTAIKFSNKEIEKKGTLATTGARNSFLKDASIRLQENYSQDVITEISNDD